MEVLARPALDYPPFPAMIAQQPGPDTKYHPFFVAPRAVPQQPNVEDTETTSSNASAPAKLNTKPGQDYSSDDEEYIPTGQNTRGRKKRKSEQDAGADGQVRRGRGRPRKKPKSLSYSIANHFVPPDASSESGAGETEAGLEPEASEAGGPVPHAPAGDAATDTDAVDSTLSPGPASGQVPPRADAEVAKPKKMLNFNLKTGTLGSPPKPKEPRTQPNQEQKPVRTRGDRKGSLIVTVSYGSDEESRLRIGKRIENILAGILEPVPTEPSTEGDSECRKQPKRTDAQAPVTTKPTHPFFLGKAQAVSEPPEAQHTPKVVLSSPSAKRFTSTPCSPKMPRAAPSSRASAAGPVRFGIKHSGLKVPGARLAAWPWKGVIRAGEVSDSSSGSIPHSLPLRKSKGNATLLAAGESVMANATSKLHVPAALEEIRNANSDDFAPPPEGLRLPRKCCESGRKLQDRIRGSLRAASTVGKSHRGKRLGSGHNETDHGLPRFFDSLQTDLSAFDRSQCESLCWAQKYAPLTAAEVLQPSRETMLLREWLVALRVQSVDTGASDAPAGGAGKRGPKAADGGKKKRKRNKLDGFVVSSEDEANEMGELSETEDEWMSSRPGLARKTVVRAGGGKDAPRLRNAIVISGPHGCGKSAAVYAAAKELDFEVFEIGPNSRRSGKDIVERVGDMTRNHLVQHRADASDSTNAEADDGAIVDDQVVQEVQSGKQATMNSFFKPKIAPKATAKPSAKHGKKTAIPPKAAAAKQATLLQEPQKQLDPKKSAPKSQKQSLILLEEVDVLYEEDKQFWATVIGLIAKSKRPFIMTCNDESLVPMQTLNLHGIFRFAAPPTDLAVDRLLIMAASEGHALGRASVQALYESRGCDLRATITDLNYWCQIGIGDRRGGFDWFYLRWPRGIDLDENGDTVRVISEGTYAEGMGWLGDDVLEVSPGNSLEREVDLLQQAWDHFGLDLGLWQDSPDMESWAHSLQPVVNSAGARLAALEAYDTFTDAMSVADLNSAMASLLSKQMLMDASVPDLPSKAKEDFTIGLPLLDVSPAISFDSTGTSISICLKALARQNLSHACTTTLGIPSSSSTSASLLEPLTTRTVISAIHTHLTTPPPSAPSITRLDFSATFDPIAVSDEPSSLSAPSTSSTLDPSVWDRTLAIVALDVAPFVRSIVSYDAHLQQQRLKLSSLLSSSHSGSGGGIGSGSDRGGGGGAGGGGPKKRMRTTRAAYSAMEGGERRTTRAERWFKADLNPYLVWGTAPKGCGLGGLGGPDETTKVGKKNDEEAAAAAVRHRSLSSSSSSSSSPRPEEAEETEGGGGDGDGDGDGKRSRPASVQVEKRRKKVTVTVTVTGSKKKGPVKGRRGRGRRKVVAESSDAEDVVTGGGGRDAVAEAAAWNDELASE